MSEHFFQRLAEERDRLGLTQDQMAKAGGVAKRTYCNYETGDREPPSSFISSVKDVGVDIGFLLFGIREFDSLGTSPSEERLLDLYRQLSDENKNALEAVAVTLAQPRLAEVMMKVTGAEKKIKKSKKVTVTANGGQAAGRDIVSTNKTTKRGN